MNWREKSKPDYSWVWWVVGLLAASWFCSSSGGGGGSGPQAETRAETIRMPTAMRTETISSCPYGCAVPPAGCNIKGNISFDSGEKIYHMPGQKYYSKTRINPDYGERWFCTEAEAVANGWRKSYE